MNIKSRLTLRLISWLVAVGVILFVLAGIVLNWTMNQLVRVEASREFNSAGLHQLIQNIQTREDKLQFDADILEQIRESGGWLQRIDDNGQVTDAFYTPADVPLSYGPGELTSYWSGKSPFPYQLYLWIQEKDGVVHTLLYGLKNRDDLLLEQIKEKGFARGSDIVLPQDIQDNLRSIGAWVQLLDAQGSELAAFNKPSGALDRYSVQELPLRTVYPDRYGTKLVSLYDQDTSMTWIVSSPLSGMEPGEVPLITPEQQVLVKSIGLLLLVALLVFILVSYWFGQQFGSPIVHVLKWLRLLGEGRYEEPVDSSGVPRSQNRKGRRKRKYRVYQDVIDSMNSLSQSLHHSEQLREDTERMREEWIAGVSHDLKTPLSSIKGYAHVLDNDSYEWTKEEMRSFAQIIIDKSSYMDELINDLTLTYKLRNGHGAPSVELVELNEYAALAIEEAANHPMYPEGNIRLIPLDTPVYILVYKPWFQRIVDNLVANALLHNENGTLLTISVQVPEPAHITLTFADNGKGMDEETAARLFERYYRGTDTESLAEGSGLGMAVTKALVEVLGGSIEVVTSIGQGTSLITRWKMAEPPMK
ncbi:sensor histidine kinase KdpD [Cohnella sp. WQ 127256]|uniref:sensor histidine kinase n=1 Tax=Cohnella sp. WQ 127256 TaxID=2938790 RepID=UPI002117A4B6|nr:HAMP domain-containing sensor histidine kinase [Cohnella sp. WQ 127256]